MLVLLLSTIAVLDPDIETGPLILKLLLGLMVVPPISIEFPESIVMDAPELSATVCENEIPK